MVNWPSVQPLRERAGSHDAFATEYQNQPTRRGQFLRQADPCDGAGAGMGVFGGIGPPPGKNGKSRDPSPAARHHRDSARIPRHAVLRGIGMVSEVPAQLAHDRGGARSTAPIIPIAATGTRASGGLSPDQTARARPRHQSGRPPTPHLPRVATSHLRCSRCLRPCPLISTEAIICWPAEERRK